jgi:hypothetical protein
LVPVHDHGLPAKLQFARHRERQIFIRLAVLLNRTQTRMSGNSPDQAVGDAPDRSLSLARTNYDRRIAHVQDAIGIEQIS